MGIFGCVLIQVDLFFGFGAGGKVWWGGWGGAVVGGSFQNPEYAWFRKPGEARFALSLMIELFIGTQFSHLYTAVDTPAIAA
jgi:hypothetical protein